MAVGPAYLADKSALSRLRLPEIDAALSPLILSGEVATCSVIDLEMLFSARSYEDLLRTQSARALAFRRIAITQPDFDRAEDVMGELARRSLHRAVGIPDLLIAAVAERAGLTLLHYDSDFDHVAAVTGQPMRWIVPRGTAP